MLEFILGGAKSGKSTHVTQKIEELITNKTVKFDITSNSGEQIILIVPEQFTYETERALFEKLGGPSFLNVKVTSFTRFAIEIFQQFGGMANDYADDCAKIVLMNKAIRACLAEEQLEIYKKTAQYTNFTTKMIATINELKLSGISHDDFNITFDDTNEYLGQKSSEIATIFSRYEAELNASPYIDQSDDLIRALEVVKQPDNIHYIKGKHIFIDEFKGFTKSEKDFIALMMQIADVYMTLCIDDERKNDQLSPFVSLLKTKDEIMKLANSCGVNITQTKLEPLKDRNEVLHHIEQNIFSFSPEEYSGTQVENSIKAVACLNEYNELEYVLSTIKLLVKDENYTYTDIAIIARDTKPYEDIYANLFEKYDIPVFYDEVNSVVDMPIIKFVQAFLACVARMSTENILTMLKCQLFDSKLISKESDTSINDFTLSKISTFENYLYVWGISGSDAFSKPFEQNPAGFKAEFTEAEKRELNSINKIREFCFTSINDFKVATKGANGFDFCLQLIKTIESMGVKRKFQNQIYVNLKNGDTQTADTFTIVWEIFNELLSTLGNTIGNEKVITTNFSELFHLVASSYDLGSVPRSLDSVTFGDAERIRVNNKKAVFVLSVNDGVFPATPSSGSLFTPKDRDVLAVLEIPIPRLGTEAIQEERFIAYKTLTSATEKLYVTARSSNSKGEALVPSSIFDELTAMFGENIIEYANELPDSYYCHTNATTVKQFLFSTDANSSRASLKEVLTNTGLPESGTNSVLLDDIDNIKSAGEFTLSEEIALELFKANMGLSPTQIENYYKCPFMYFCQYGLRVRELRKAKIDPSNAGSLIHQVLENIVKTLDFTTAFDKNIIDSTIQAEITDYVDNQMGGADMQTNRFNYICNRMINPLSVIIKRIYDEFSGSAFKPYGYEAEIGSSSDLPALELDSDNGTIKVTGTIDRVDLWSDKDSGNTYVRVVDYKSGTKKFDLNEVCHGLNLQMLIYLLAITENGNGVYNDSKPAGILYMPSGEKSPISLESSNGYEDTNSKFFKQYQMNGLLINNPHVIDAMEEYEDIKDIEYIPNPKKSSIEEDKFYELNELIKEQICDMVNSLHEGSIPATPIDGDNKPCRYCKYESICNYKNVREFNKNKYEEIFSSDDTSDDTNETDEIGG